MEDGERSCSDSDDGSSASWVILNDDEHVSEAEDPLATTGAGLTPVPDGDPANSPATDPATAPTTVQQSEEGMDSSGDSAKTVIERPGVSAVGTAAEAAPTEPSKTEEGSDIEVLATEHPDDAYFEDDPMELSLDVSEEGSSVSSSGSVSGGILVGSLPSETVLRQRHTAVRAPDEPEELPQSQNKGMSTDTGTDTGADTGTTDKDTGADKDKNTVADTGTDTGGEKEKEGDEKDAQRIPDKPQTRPAVQVVPADSDRDRWADDTDLSSLTDQMAVGESLYAGRLRQYVHQRNNTVNHLLTVLLVLCFTCVLGLGVGHFLGWLHHHEMTEEMVHTLDEKLDVLRDDLMTCMTTEDDQDLDNKWIKELLTENEALLQQLHSDDEHGADVAPHCSAADYTHLRDLVNQLRMENDELKASIAKMRYGTSSQDGYVLRRHRDQINQLVTENGELARELRRTRYLQPPTGLTDQEDDPAPSAGQPPHGPPGVESVYGDSDSPDSADSDSDTDSPGFPHPAAVMADSPDDSETPSTTFSDSDSDSGDSESESGSADGGLLSALLGWRPAPGSAPLQEARRRLWGLWQEASDFARAEPASKYVKMAGRSLAKVETAMMKAIEKVKRFGEQLLEDDEVGGGRVEKIAGKLGRKVDKVVAKLDARWQEIRRNWEGKVAAREAEEEVPTPTADDTPTGLPPNDTDPSVAAFYARRSRHRQRARGEEGDENWQLGRGKSRAEMRGAFHGGSWLLERALARQQLRQRRGEEAEVPHADQRWRQEWSGRGEEAPRSEGRKRYEWEHSRHEWRAMDDDDDLDDDDDDDDDDYKDHAARLARHMAANARFQERIQKTVQRHAAKINRKVRENHWKHFGGRNRHEFRQRMHKY